MPVPVAGGAGRLRARRASGRGGQRAGTRFKLLGLLPIFEGAAIFMLSFLGLSPDQSRFIPTADHLCLVTGVSMLGFVTTLGIVFYDQRNSELYNSLIHHAKFLE